MNMINMRDFIGEVEDILFVVLITPQMKVERLTFLYLWTLIKKNLLVNIRDWGKSCTNEV